MDEDGPRAAEEPDPEDGSSKTFVCLNDLSGDGGRPGPGDKEKDPGSGDSEGEALPYPALAPVVFFYLSQHSRPRSWCLRMVCNPYPLRELVAAGQVVAAGAAKVSPSSTRTHPEASKVREVSLRAPLVPPAPKVEPAEGGWRRLQGGRPLGPACKFSERFGEGRGAKCDY